MDFRLSLHITLMQCASVEVIVDMGYYCGHSLRPCGFTTAPGSLHTLVILPRSTRWFTYASDKAEHAH